MSSEPDPQALQERIDELEATVQKMLPGRRAFLAGAAGAAVGAVGMQSASNVGEASDGTAVGQIGTSSEPVNVVAHDVTSDSVDTEEINRVRQLDPDVSDFGAAVNDKLSSMVDGDVLIVPPVEYTQSTAVTVDKRVTIFGWALGMITNSSGSVETKPYIERTADVPHFKIEAPCTLYGLFMQGDRTETSPPVLANQKCRLESIRVRNSGTHAVHLLQADSAHNLNNTVVSNLYAVNCDGDAVRTENTSGGPSDINAMNIHVSNAYGVSGYAVNDGGGGPGGAGNKIKVNNAHDTGIFAPDGAVKLNGNEADARIHYIHGGVSTGVVFGPESDFNEAWTHYNTTSTKFTDAGNGNLFNGVGEETANAEQPTAANYRPGSVVDFTDSGDGSGDGVYLLLRDETWVQIGT